jgi:hypothetical protein
MPVLIIAGRQAEILDSAAGCLSKPDVKGDNRLVAKANGGTEKSMIEELRDRTATKRIEAERTVRVEAQT